jgi:hypothetical protein
VTFGEWAQIVIVLAALHRASGAVIGLGLGALIVLQRIRRRIPSPWNNAR